VFAGSGARWWAGIPESELLEALGVVDACLRVVAVCRPAWWALENPVGRLKKWLGPYQMTFNPCDYGGWVDPPDAYTKRTCLWGQFNEPVKKPVEPTEGSKIHRYPPTADRAALRSITPAGFANAFMAANP
jgi:hypothetical protein